MGSVVQIEGVGNVQFPDTMSDDEVGQASHKLYTGAAAQKISSSPPGVPRPQVDMQSSFAGTLEGGPTDVPASGSKVPRSIQNAPDEAGEAIGGMAIGGTAAMAAAPVIGPPARLVGRVMAKHPILSSMAIGEARKIPYVGKIIPPYAEWAPFLAGRGGRSAPAEAAEGEALEQAAKPKLVEQIKQSTTPTEPYPTTPSNWPPEAPTTKTQFPTPAPRGYQALQEEQSLVDQIRNQVAGEDRMRLRREPLGTPKGALNQQFDEAMGKSQPPVKYTKTPSSASPKTPGTPATDDLTPILRESLKQAMKKTGR